MDSEVPKRVFKKYLADLTKVLTNSSHRIDIAIILYSNELIPEQAYEDAFDDSTRTDIMKSACLTKAIKNSIDGHPEHLLKFIDVLKNHEVLKHVIKKMKTAIEE